MMDRRFGTEELGNAFGSELDEALAMGRLLEAAVAETGADATTATASMDSATGVTADLGDRIMAALADEPAPTPAGFLIPLRRRGFLHGLVASFRQASVAMRGSGRPAVGRVAALAYVLVLSVAGLSITGAAGLGAAGALGLLGPTATQAPTPTPTSTPTPPPPPPPQSPTVAPPTQEPSLPPPSTAPTPPAPTPSPTESDDHGGNSGPGGGGNGGENEPSDDHGGNSGHGGGGEAEPSDDHGGDSDSGSGGGGSDDGSGSGHDGRDD